MNEGVWVALSFVAFVALVWKKAAQALTALLDKRSQDIKASLDDARILRENAQAELHKYQKLSREATQQAEQITANALEAAEKIRSDAEKAATAAVKRKEAQARAKIKTMEAEVINEIRKHAAQAATAAAETLIKEKLDPKTANQIIKADLEKIKKID